MKPKKPKVCEGCGARLSKGNKKNLCDACEERLDERDAEFSDADIYFDDDGHRP